MKERQKEFNETANVAIVIQKQMDDCETLEEAYHMFESWTEFVKNQYLRRIGELTDN
jgi:hypothetical protein